MQTIYKYTLPYGNFKTLIQMPAGAKILSVNNQRGIPCLWALVDTLKPLVARSIRAVHTGERCLEAFEEAVFVGTVLLNDDAYVLHVFDMG